MKKYEIYLRDNQGIFEILRMNREHFTSRELKKITTSMLSQAATGEYSYLNAVVWCDGTPVIDVICNITDWITDDGYYTADISITISRAYESNYMPLKHVVIVN